MKTTRILFGLFLFASLLNAQKVVQKTIVGTNNQYIQIDTKNCYKVELQTLDSKKLRAEAFIEGHYQKDVVVKIEEDGANILIGVGYLPNFSIPNDKLGAHRLTPSIALKIYVPEYTNTSVYGTNSAVFASGKFKGLKVTLANGDCTIENATETVEVKTQKGNIYLVANEGEVTAKSDYGLVKKIELPKGNSTYKLATIEGNIYISKTE